MSVFSLEDCNSWSVVNSVKSESPVSSHVMIVKNFDSLVKEMEVGKCVQSAKFDVGETKWKVTVYPAGYNEENQEYITISLLNCNDKDVKARVKILCAEVQMEFIRTIRKNNGWGSQKFMRKDDCLKKLVNNELQVKVDVSIIKEVENKIISGSGLKKDEEKIASKYFTKIYNSKDYSDFKIVSNGSEFECHKTVLATQSEAFQAVIDRWAPNGKMILDEYKPEVVDNLLRHCYLQPLEENVFEENVTEFLNIGEKYGLQDLKAKAELFMISNMNKETVIEFLEAGHLFAAVQVKEAALRFLSLNKSIWQENFGEWKDKLKGKEELLLEIVTHLIT